MPQIGDLTVKKADGTTDIVYSAVVPSSGDKTPAVFKAMNVGTSGSTRPEFRVSASPNRARTTRVVEATLVYPTVKTVDGLTSVAHRTLIDVRVTLPQGAPDADTDEAVNQAINLVGTTLMRACMTTGYAPS